MTPAFPEPLTRVGWARIIIKMIGGSSGHAAGDAEYEISCDDKDPKKTK